MASDKDPSEHSLDDFLGGKLKVCQPIKGFRAGTDSLLLSAAVPAQPGQRGLELCAGVGVPSLALCARVPGLDLTLVEQNPEVASLTRRNVALNRGKLSVLSLDVREGDALDRRLFPPNHKFDFTLINPPFFDALASRGSPVLAKDQGRRSEATTLDWVQALARWTRPKGWMVMILRAQQVVAALCALEPRAGQIELRPLLPKLGANAVNVIIRARLGVKTPPQILPALHIRDENRQISDLVARIQRYGTEFI